MKFISKFTDMIAFAVYNGPTRIAGLALVEELLRMQKITPLIVILLMSGQTLVLAASTHRLVGSTNFNESHYLYDLNLETGIASRERKIGFDHPLSIVAGITYDTRLNQAYALTTLPWSRLLQFDPFTGDVIRDVRTGMPSVYEGDVAIHPITGQIYGIQNASSQGPQLFRINADTGSAEIIGPVAATGDYSALAFDGLGTLYTIDTSGTTNSKSEVIDPVGAINLSVMDLSLDLGSTAALTFHPLTGAAYVADGASDGDGTNTLYQLDIGTGILSPIGHTGLEFGIAGLMFVAVPEPNGILLALCLVPSAVLHGRMTRSGHTPPLTLPLSQSAPFA